MTIDEINILSELREVVAARAGGDPMRIALDRHVPHAALVATQVKYLQRAADKLPSWAAAGCIIPRLAFEQSSSETVALHRFADVQGTLAIDLTCGLGVDAWALSQRFERVIAVERDPAVAHLARVNFALLGASNIEVVTAAAEDFAVPENADLIYIDADRRGARGEKLVLLEDCSPNVLALMPFLHGDVVLKLSPMFDVEEAQRVLGGSVEVISSGGECREVVVRPHAEPAIIATVLGFGRIIQNERSVIQRSRASVTVESASEASLSDDGLASLADSTPASRALNDAKKTPHSSLLTPNYLVVPDAALVKARLAREYFTARGMWMESDTGFAFAAAEPVPDAEGRTGVPGRVWRIESMERFDPKALRREGLRKGDIMARDFPFSAAQVARQIGIREGGTAMFAFTRLQGGLWTIRVISGE